MGIREDDNIVGEVRDGRICTGSHTVHDIKYHIVWITKIDMKY
jgi:hypothetical protein